MGTIINLPYVTPYSSDTPNYANLTWGLLTQNGLYGVSGSSNSTYFSTAIVSGQQAIDSLNPKTYNDKQAYLFELANDSETSQYFNIQYIDQYAHRNFIVASNYPFTFCHGAYETRNGTPTVFEVTLNNVIQYNNKSYFMLCIGIISYWGSTSYTTTGCFSGVSSPFYSIAQFLQSQPQILPVERLQWTAHGEYLVSNCSTAYGHKIGYGEPYFYPNMEYGFASGTPATMKIAPSSGYSFAKPGHLKVFKDGVEIPYTQDLANGLINFTTP